MKKNLKKLLDAINARKAKIKTLVENDQLENYVNVERVSTKTGTRVIEIDADSTEWPEIEEGDDFQEQDTPKLRSISYKIKKFGGILKVTAELLEDTAENILAYLKKWIAKKSRATRNAKILAAWKECVGDTSYPAMVAAVDSYRSECGSFSTWLGYHLKTAFAEATGYRSKKQQQDPIHRATSLDTPLSDEADGDDLMAVIADPAGMKGLEAAEEAIYHQQLHDALEAALDAIPEQYSEVLRQRHYDGLSLAEIGESRGVSAEYVRRLEYKAIRYIHRPSIACHLRPFCDFDFYCGTSLSAFQHTGMSIQERYLVIEEERRERAERERRSRYEASTAAADAVLASSRRLAEELIQELSPEARERLEKMLLS